VLAVVIILLAVAVVAGAYVYSKKPDDAGQKAAYEHGGMMVQNPHQANPSYANPMYDTNQGGGRADSMA